MTAETAEGTAGVPPAAAGGKGPQASRLRLWGGKGPQASRLRLAGRRLSCGCVDGRDGRPPVGFRNLIVHKYGRLDLETVYRVAQEEDLADLESFARAITRRFPA